MFRSGYDHLDPKKQYRSKLEFVDSDGELLTECHVEQSHKKDCDINNVLRKYDRTGLITHVNTATAQYGDFTEINEYRENLDMVIAAQNAFDELPAEIRKKFGNDPGNFFEYATNPENAEGMIELGLAVPPPEPEVMQVEVVNTASEADSGMA